MSYLPIKLISAERTEDDGTTTYTIYGPLPEPKAITIDPRPAVEKLGLSAIFGIAYEVGSIKMAKIPMPGISMFGAEYSTIVTEHSDQGSPNWNRIVSIVKEDVFGNVEYVGHIALTGDTGDEANIFYTFFEEYIGEATEDTPQEIKAIVEWFAKKGNLDVAVRVAESYKGKGYGKVLWLIMLAYCEYADIKSVKISGDITVGQDPKRPWDSFYERLGAKPVIYITPEEGPHDTGIFLRAPTTLSESQIDLLKTVFSTDTPQ